MPVVFVPPYGAGVVVVAVGVSPTEDDEDEEDAGAQLEELGSVNTALSPFAPIAVSEIVAEHFDCVRSVKSTVNLPALEACAVRTSFVLPDRNVTPTRSPALEVGAEHPGSRRLPGHCLAGHREVPK